MGGVWIYSGTAQCDWCIIQSDTGILGKRKSLFISAFVNCFAEAVDAILSYSHTASQLLRRKKVKRDHIYQYLAENGAIEPVSSDKPSLIRRVLLFWGSKQEVGDVCIQQINSLNISN